MDQSGLCLHAGKLPASGEVSFQGSSSNSQEMTNFEDKPAAELPAGSSEKTMVSKPDLETLKFSETQEDSNLKEELVTKDGDEKKKDQVEKKFKSMEDACFGAGCFRLPSLGRSPNSSKYENLKKDKKSKKSDVEKLNKKLEKMNSKIERILAKKQEYEDRLKEAKENQVPVKAGSLDIDAQDKDISKDELKKLEAELAGEKLDLEPSEEKNDEAAKVSFELPHGEKAWGTNGFTASAE